MSFGDSLVIFPALKVNRGQQKQDARVGGILPPELHAVLLRVLVIAALVLAVGQLGKA